MSKKLDKIQGRNYIFTNWEYAQKAGWRLMSSHPDPQVRQIVQRLIIEGQKEIDHWKKAYKKAVEDLSA